MEQIRENFRTIKDILSFWSNTEPKKTAYTFLVDGEDKTETITYSALEKEVEKIASHLVSQNLQGERVLLLYPSGLDYITAFLGCLYAGVIAVPAYPPRPNRSLERISSIVSDSDAKGALITEKLLIDISKKFPEDAKLSKLIWITTDNLHEELSCQLPNITERSIAFLQYTSGSTGNPKGVIVKHQHLIHNQRIIKNAFEHDESDCVVGWLPIYHDMGLIGNILQSLYMGIPCVLMSPMSFLQKPIRWLKAIDKFKGTTSGGPNFAYELCVEKITDIQAAELDLSTWKLAFNGAEPVRLSTIEKFSEKFKISGFRKTSFYPCYGMAEATLFITGGLKAEQPSALQITPESLEKNEIVVKNHDINTLKITDCGKTRCEQEIVIADAASFDELKENRVGEIWVSGRSVADGYWNRPEDTKTTFEAYTNGRKGPFLRTGDLGFIKDGNLYVTGRLKDLIIIRGKNYYPHDIELAVSNCHSALRAEGGAAFSILKDGEERLVIVQELERVAIQGLDEQNVFETVNAIVSEKFDLKVFAIVLIVTGSLPKTSSGKTQRRACKEEYLSGSLRVVTKWEELKPDWNKKTEVKTEPEKRSLEFKSKVSIQNWLIQKISEYFKLDPQTIDLEDSLDKYGMDSLIAVQLSEEFSKYTGQKVSQTVVYDYPSIKLLSGYLSNLSEISGQKISENDVNSGREPIAVVGMGCRFPGAGNLADYESLLKEGKNGIRKIPQSRYSFKNDKISDNTEEIEWAGLIDNIDQFDPQFFGISPTEASSIDPQQRIILEVTWEALEDAGIPLNEIMGTNTGVFIGVSNNEYGQLQFQSKSTLTPYSGTGNAFSIVANRLSYFMDLKGPSIAMDTACSSSLVAIHQACQSIREGDCDFAIAGGVNLILTQNLTTIFSKAQMLAKDGQCKTFDAEADGYVRGEGCGVIILKRLSRAVKDGDTIYGLIKGSAINQDGRSNGLTAPNGPSQEAVIRKAAKAAGIEPSMLGYIETHGSGTPLGDPIEVNALKNVLKADHNSECFIGSVKTNIGHLEAAAGVAGFIKAVLSINKKLIFPHLNFNSLNREILIEGSPINIPLKLAEWKSVRKRFAGVSSFGFGGTNAHIILEEFISEKRDTKSKRTGRTHHLFTLSAKNRGALYQSVDRHIKLFESNEIQDIEDICYAANVTRSHFKERITFIVKSAQELKDKLLEFKSLQNQSVVSECGRLSSIRKTAFVFTGQGAQYPQMGKQLFETEPVFSDALKSCDSILKSYLDVSILDVLYGPENNASINQTFYTQPLLFAIEYALSKLWKSWGIEPDAVIGHSVGEYVAACISGVFSLEDALKLISGRAKLMQSLPENEGEMVVVFSARDNVGQLLTDHKETISIAATNGPEQTVISGEKDALVAVISKLEELHIKWSKLRVSHAFHSPFMRPILAAFTDIAKSIQYNLPSINIISNVSGDFISEKITTPEYWVEHVMAPVNFYDGIKSLQREGFTTYIEVGPKPTLLPAMKEYLSEKDLNVFTLCPGKSDWESIFINLSELYLNDYHITWREVYKNCASKISLPSYPFQKARYWFTDSLPQQQKRVSQYNHPILGHLSKDTQTADSFIWDRKMERDFVAYLKTYKVNGRSIIPYSTFIEVAMAAVKEAYGHDKVNIKNMVVHEAFFPESTKERIIRTALSKSSEGNIEVDISSSDEVSTEEITHASAKIEIPFVLQNITYN